MSRYTVWIEGNGKYSVHDSRTDETAKDEEGKLLTNLTFDQAAEHVWEMNKPPSKKP
jgi:hypothetical protein